MSAPLKPGVARAIVSRSTPSSIGTGLAYRSSSCRLRYEGEPMRGERLRGGASEGRGAAGRQRAGDRERAEVVDVGWAQVWVEQVGVPPLYVRQRHLWQAQTRGKPIRGSGGERAQGSRGRLRGWERGSRESFDQRARGLQEEV
eukprot:1797728-Prymnesium_polylepis.1